MFTWNFQYISKTRLAEVFKQLMLDPEKGDILIRIHTAIHTEDESVELARFIAKLVPGAHIFGTSTSAVICWGRLIQNQCVISVTQMSKGHIESALLDTYDENDQPTDYVLHAGDSVHFGKGTKRGCKNTGDTTAQMLVIMIKPRA